MIYLIIADKDSIKKDCLDMWQSCNLFSGEIKEYISNTKNQKTKNERILSYTALLSSLKELFSVENIKLERNKNGKPYIKDSSIHISISHSDETCAIALSNEGEIGVDIQCRVDEERGERLSKRFLSEIQPRQDEMNIKYLYMTLTENAALFSEICLIKDNETDFLTKWVYLESVIKAYGLSFSDISKISELEQNTKTTIFNSKNYKIAVTKTV